jgi:hypothetical protein
MFRYPTGRPAPGGATGAEALWNTVGLAHRRDASDSPRRGHADRQQHRRACRRGRSRKAFRYGSEPSRWPDLTAIEQLHKDDMIG